MKTFQIVRMISRGRAAFNGKMVNTTMAIVNFDTQDDGQLELTTRHLHHEAILDKDGKVIGVAWVGHNTDQARSTRQAMLQAFVVYKTTAETTTARVSKLESDLLGLKGKKGVTEDRKKLREALKTAKAASAMAISDFERVKAIDDKIDDTHPEFVQFV